MVEILGGTSDSDLLEVVSNIQSSIHILTMPQKLTLNIFYLNIIYLRRQIKLMNMLRYILEMNYKIALPSVKIFC